MSDIEPQVIDEAEHEQDDLRDHQTAASSKNTFRTIATLLGLIVVAFWSSWAMSDRGDSEIQDIKHLFCSNTDLMLSPLLMIFLL